MFLTCFLFNGQKDQQETYSPDAAKDELTLFPIWQTKLKKKSALNSQQSSFLNIWVILNLLI